MDGGFSEQPGKEVPDQLAPSVDLPDLEFWPQLEFDPDYMQSFDWIDGAASGQPAAAMPAPSREAQLLVHGVELQSIAAAAVDRDILDSRLRAADHIPAAQSLTTAFQRGALNTDAVGDIEPIFLCNWCMHGWG